MEVFAFNVDLGGMSDFFNCHFFSVSCTLLSD